MSCCEHAGTVATFFGSLSVSPKLLASELERFWMVLHPLSNKTAAESKIHLGISSPRWPRQ